jgi:hypothetical protein
MKAYFIAVASREGVRPIFHIDKLSMLANAIDTGMFLIKAVKSYETWKAYYYSALKLRDPEGVVVKRMTENEAKQRARNIIS